MPEIGAGDSVADHETLVTRLDDSVAENAGSGVGATAVFDDGVEGTLTGAPAGDASSNDHSPSAGIIPGGADSDAVPPKDSVPNDIDAV